MNGYEEQERSMTMKTTITTGDNNTDNINVSISII